MAPKKSKYLPPKTIKQDRKALLALKKLTDYRPPSPDLSIEAVCAIEQRLREKEERVDDSTKDLSADRSSCKDTGLELHNAMVRIKTIVRGQYGPNSQELASLGLKKEDDYQRAVQRLPQPEKQPA